MTQIERHQTVGAAVDGRLQNHFISTASYSTIRGTDAKTIMVSSIALDKKEPTGCSRIAAENCDEYVRIKNILHGSSGQYDTKCNINERRFGRSLSAPLLMIYLLAVRSAS